MDSLRIVSKRYKTKHAQQKLKIAKIVFLNLLYLHFKDNSNFRGMILFKEIKCTDILIMKCLSKYILIEFKENGK